MQSESAEHSALVCKVVVVGADVEVVEAVFTPVVGGDVEGTAGCVVSSTVANVVVDWIGLLTQPEYSAKPASMIMSICRIIAPVLCTP